MKQRLSITANTKYEHELIARDDQVLTLTLENPCSEANLILRYPLQTVGIRLVQLWKMRQLTVRSLRMKSVRKSCDSPFD